MAVAMGEEEDDDNPFALLFWEDDSVQQRVETMMEMMPLHSSLPRWLWHRPYQSQRAHRHLLNQIYYSNRPP